MRDKLKQSRVLVVEDESLVALLIEDILGDLGCQSVMVAPRVAHAVKLLEESDVDLALLDINVAGQTVYPVADILDARGVPFLFLTGYAESGISGKWTDRPVLQKPFQNEHLIDALAELLDQPAD